MGGTYSSHRGDKKCGDILDEKFDSKNPLERGRHRWEDNINKDFKGKSYGLIQLPQDVDK
jgi:hypothetical protein